MNLLISYASTGMAKELNFHFSTISRVYVKHIENMKFPDLKKEGLVIPNKDFNKTLSLKMANWGLDLIKECHRVGELENEN